MGLSLLRPPQFSFGTIGQFCFARCVWIYSVVLIVFANMCESTESRVARLSIQSVGATMFFPLPTSHFPLPTTLTVHTGSPIPSRASVYPRLSRLSKPLPEISDFFCGRRSICNPTPKVLVFRPVLLCHVYCVGDLACNFVLLVSRLEGNCLPADATPDATGI